ncbi:N-acetylglucosamine/diacetylchitobiose ABC transporter substrate-binding protein [Streptomyces sp. NPDC090032]|uniref:N-acetylglucosamine/diacetylchitobiose ABC transporter substrate-binding protein n=1 Tax=unclassified Streptomyces TaxID=2593676 RepID=UPI003711B612
MEGCALGEHGAQSTTDTVEKTADNPFGLADKGNVELVWFKGGSPAYLPDAVDPLFRKKHPDVRIERRSTERMSQTLQPRFVGGNPPDCVDNSGADSLDVGVLIQDGQVLDLTALYEAPSLDDPKKTVKETLLPGAYEDTLVDGRPYSLAYYSRGFGLWYDAHFFEGKGWQVPDTWSAFLTLCEQIKEAGVIPYGFAGKNTADYHSNVLLTSAAKLGGPEILRAVDNLEPHAWEAAAIKKAAEAWAHVGATYSDMSFEGLIHTEVQLRQNQHKVAFYPSGDWLESEQKASTPKGFRYAMAPTPSLTSHDKLPAHAIYATFGGGGTFVPAKARNPAAALEYMRLMYSRTAARAFTEASGWLTTVSGVADGVTLPPGTASSQRALEAAGADNVLVNWKFNTWYKPLAEELKSAVLDLSFGRASADAFAARMQKKADAMKKDVSVKKYRR